MPEPAVTEMNPSSVRIVHEGAACVVTLDRPAKRNAISVAMMHEIAAAARAAEADPAVAAVIVTGGPAFFSAGAELNECSPPTRSTRPRRSASA
jgi:enoyl-CoA hydratase